MRSPRSCGCCCQTSTQVRERAGATRPVGDGAAVCCVCAVPTATCTSGSVACLQPCSSVPTPDLLVEENPAMLDVPGLRAAIAEAARIMPNVDVQARPGVAGAGGPAATQVDAAAEDDAATWKNVRIAHVEGGSDQPALLTPRTCPSFARQLRSALPPSPPPSTTPLVRAESDGRRPPDDLLLPARLPAHSLRPPTPGDGAGGG